MRTNRLYTAMYVIYRADESYVENLYQLHYPIRLPIDEMMGVTLYVPIPYAMRCKVTIESPDLQDYSGGEP